MIVAVHLDMHHTKEKAKEKLLKFQKFYHENSSLEVTCNCVYKARAKSYSSIFNDSRKSGIELTEASELAFKGMYGEASKLCLNCRGTGKVMKCLNLNHKFSTVEKVGASREATISEIVKTFDAIVSEGIWYNLTIKKDEDSFKSLIKEGTIIISPLEVRE